MKKLINFFKKDISDRRLFFSVNSGRSGSQYLAELLGTADEVTSFHEAEPAMNGEYLQMINSHDYETTYKRRKIKCKAIYNALKDMKENEIYCETNHMFIKTFFDVVIDEFKNIEVIILRRALSFVLKSFIELGYFSDKNPAWMDWMTSPNAKTAALACIGPDSELDQYDLCIAYLFDIEARAIRFQKEYPWIRTHEIRLESLNAYPEVMRLFQNLKITPTESTHKMLGQIVNARAKAKDAYNNSSKIEYCRARIQEYINKARALKIPLPQSIVAESLIIKDV